MSGVVGYGPPGRVDCDRDPEAHWYRLFVSERIVFWCPSFKGEIRPGELVALSTPGEVDYGTTARICP